MNEIYIEAFIKAINEGKLTIEQVPEQYREAVQERLK